MREFLSGRPKKAVTCCILVCLNIGLAAVKVDAAEPPTSVDAVTNIVQLYSLASQNPGFSHSIHLAGTVFWADPNEGRLILHDDSGAAELELEVRGEFVQAGDEVTIEGNGTIARRGAGFRIGPKGPTVDNDGVHSLVEKSGSIFLTA